MSAADDLGQNESMCVSEEFALEVLMDGADSARALLANLPDANAQALSKHPIVAMAYALLVHLDHRAEEQYLQGREFIEELRSIRESVNLAVLPRSEEPQAASKQALSDYAFLKELLEHARPAFSAAQYEEAIIRLRRVAGV